MSDKILVFFYVLISINLVLSLTCVPWACDNVKCPEVKCRDGELHGKGGNCLCCDICRRIIGNQHILYINTS